MSIPTYSERENLKELLPFLWELPPHYHVLILNDESGDGSPAWLRSLPQYQQRLFLIERPGKMGLGTAYVEGFRWGLQRHYTHFLQMDADLSHNPSDIPKMVDGLRSGHGMTVGTRYKGGVRVVNWPLKRLLLSVGASYYVRFLTGLPLTDPTGGFKGFHRSSLEKLDLEKIRSNGYMFQIEVSYKLWKKNVSFLEVPIIFTERREGESKMSPSIITEAASQVFLLGLKSLRHRLRAKFRPSH
ncbi:MAG: polyprenol monophosphomannose synthase [Blastochloris sp.]|nr:polyprenol monophosphomannose synthase [Blastochloris sp.]